MKWVTRDYIHFDRAASTWLIKRFVDRDMQLSYVPWGEEGSRPKDATAYGVPDVELAAADTTSSTFERILVKHQLTDPALVRMGKMVTAGVRLSRGAPKPQPDETDTQIAIGIVAVSDGLMLTNATDDAIVAANLPIYDALYATFRAQALMQAQGKSVPKGGVGPKAKTDFLRALVKDSGPA